MVEDKVNPIPEGMHSITPHLVCRDASAAIDFYKKAFGAVECSRLPGPDGLLMHASIKIGDSPVMLIDESPRYYNQGPKTLNGTPVTMHLHVSDADAVAKQAVDAGAKSILPVSDMFWGDRYGIIEDPFGHRWAVATRVRNLSSDEIKNAVPQMGCPEAAQ